MGTSSDFSFVACWSNIRDSPVTFHLNTFKELGGGFRSFSTKNLGCSNVRDIKYTATQCAYTFQFSDPGVDIYAQFLNDIRICQKKSETPVEDMCDSNKKPDDEIMQYIADIIDQWVSKTPETCLPSSTLQFVTSAAGDHEASVRFSITKSTNRISECELQTNFIKLILLANGDAEKMSSAEGSIKSLIDLHSADRRNNGFSKKNIDHFITGAVLNHLRTPSQKRSTIIVKWVEESSGATGTPPSPQSKQRAYTFEIQWKNGEEPHYIGDGEKNICNKQGYILQRISGEALRMVYRNANKDLIFFGDMKENLRGSVLAVFTSDINGMGDDAMASLIDDRVKKYEMNSKILSYISHLFEQWLEKTDPKFKPSVEFSISLLSNGEFRVACDCIVYDSQCENKKLRQWRLNKNILATCVKSCKDFESTLPNAFWAVKRFIEVFNNQNVEDGVDINVANTVPVDVGRYVTRELLKLMESGSCPERAGYQRVKKSFSWWTLVDFIPGVSRIIDGITEIRRGEHISGVEKVVKGGIDLMMGVAKIAKDVLSFVRSGRGIFLAFKSILSINN